MRDNASSLIWQGQTPAGTGLRANDQYKTNFDSTTGNQNSNYGTPIPATQAQIDASSNSIGFKNAVNATNLCGSAAWRLPTKDELLGIVKPSESPRIDNTWFPNTPSYWYWTSSPYAAYTHAAWGVYFANNGYADSIYRGDGSNLNLLVRLVR